MTDYMERLRDQRAEARAEQLTEGMPDPAEPCDSGPWCAWSCDPTEDAGDGVRFVRDGDHDGQARVFPCSCEHHQP